MVISNLADIQECHFIRSTFGLRSLEESLEHKNRINCAPLPSKPELLRSQHPLRLSNGGHLPGHPSSHQPQDVGRHRDRPVHAWLEGITTLKPIYI